MWITEVKSGLKQNMMVLNHVVKFLENQIQNEEGDRGTRLINTQNSAKIKKNH